MQVKKISILGLLFWIFTLGTLLVLTYFSINSAFELWNKEAVFIDVTNRPLTSTLLAMINNLFYNFIGSYKIASIILFGLGCYSFYIFVMTIVNHYENFKKKL